MFVRSFEKSLELVDPKDYPAVLSYIIKAQLEHIISYISPNDTHAFIQKHLAKNVETLNDVVNLDKNNQYPILFCYLALITDNINELDKAKLDNAINWLE